MAEFAERGALVAKAKIWDFSCPDWWDRIKAGRTPVADLPLDKGRAEKAIAIFERLKLPDVDGTPLLATHCGEWFKDLVRVAFGSVDDTGRRHVPEIFALVGKKNSKTTYSAALIVTASLINQVPRAEILFVGPTQEIADTAFQALVGMIEEDDYLRNRFHVRDHIKQVLDRVTKAVIKIKTFDMKVMTGSKPLIVLLDELHIMGAMHYATRVIRQIRGALVRRPDSLLLIISTQSDQAPVGAFKEELGLARDIRDGKYKGEPRMLPILFEFPDKMQRDENKPWADPENWRYVMPNLGLSLDLENMVKDFRSEQAKGRAAEILWASQHLNIEIGIGIGGWRGADYWLKATLVLTLDELLERAEVCTIGIDGGGLDDLFGLTVTGRDSETGEWIAWSHGWVHRDVLDLRKDIASQLEDFAKAGELTICENATDDIFGVCDIVEKVFLSGKLPEKNGVGLDPQGVSALVDELSNREIHTTENGGPVTGIAQGYRLSPAIWGMERKLKDRTYRPADQAITKWCTSNAKAEQRGNAVIIDKAIAGKAKIDLLISAFNAFMLMARNPDAAGASYTAENGIFVA